MKKNINRRNFIKISSVAAIGSAAFLSGTGFGKSSELKQTRVITWGAPGGDVLTSADYDVTLKSNGNAWKPYVNYSFNRSVDKSIDKERKYLKNAFLELHANQYVRPQDDNDTYAHSWAHFDFEGGPVDVEVKISKNVEGLELPLKSCGIFPLELGIECKIVGSDTVSFTLEKPAKIAIVPNYLQALEKIKTSDTMKVLDGYRNPLFLFARSPEKNIPDKNALGTLVVKPGQMYSPADFDKATLIYFEPGVHEYSFFNDADDFNYINLKTGQTMYLAGGSYVYGHVSSKIKQPVNDMPLIFGRGTLSGLRTVWTGVPYVTTQIRNVRLDGINVTDQHDHLSHSKSPFRDIAVVGAWHGNTDGVTVEGPAIDSFTGWHVDDCFVMAADTNLKFRGSARIRNYTIWQLANSEPFWIADSNDSYVDGVYVICFNKIAPVMSADPGQIVNFQVPVSSNMKNITVKNLFCEAPFTTRLFLLQSNYTGAGSAYKNILFENIIINTPKILMKSPVGRKDEKCSPFGKITFRNLVINGRKVTNENCTDYFKLLPGVTTGKEINFE
jgi:hypothetical protein